MSEEKAWCREDCESCDKEPCNECCLDLPNDHPKCVNCPTANAYGCPLEGEVYSGD